MTSLPRKTLTPSQAQPVVEATLPLALLFEEYDCPPRLPAARIGAYEWACRAGSYGYDGWLYCRPQLPPPPRLPAHCSPPTAPAPAPHGTAARTAPPLIARQVWGAHWSHIIASIHNRVPGRSSAACHMTAGGSCAVLRRWMRSVLVWSTHPFLASTTLHHVLPPTHHYCWMPQKEEGNNFKISETGVDSQYLQIIFAVASGMVNQPASATPSKYARMRRVHLCREMHQPVHQSGFNSAFWFTRPATAPEQSFTCFPMLCSSKPAVEYLWEIFPTAAISLDWRLHSFLKVDRWQVQKSVFLGAILFFQIRGRRYCFIFNFEQKVILSEFALVELWLERLLQASRRRGWKRLGDRTFSFSNFFSFLLLSNVTIASSIYAEKNKLSNFCKMLLSRPGAILYISLSVLQYKSSPDHSILETSPMGGNHYSILEAGGHPPFNPGLNSLFLAPTPPTGAI